MPDGSYYARSGSNKCSKCGSPMTNALILVGIILGLIAYVVFIIGVVLYYPNRAN